LKQESIENSNEVSRKPLLPPNLLKAAFPFSYFVLSLNIKM